MAGEPPLRFTPTVIMSADRRSQNQPGGYWQNRTLNSAVVNGRVWVGTCRFNGLIGPLHSSTCCLKSATSARDRARSRSHHRRHQAAARSLAHGDKGAQHLQRGPRCNPNKCTRRAAHRGSLPVPVQPPQHQLQRQGQALKLQRSDRSALRFAGSFRTRVNDAAVDVCWAAIGVGNEP